MHKKIGLTKEQSWIWSTFKAACVAYGAIEYVYIRLQYRFTSVNVWQVESIS